ncbi:MAG: O-antigen ligase family protein [Lactobacillaceae bacterium]|jgi:hypothetical protein|nr:O-antigen ligase family protein [Lactobacillaceae bacterium]
MITRLQNQLENVMPALFGTGLVIYAFTALAFYSYALNPANLVNGYAGTYLILLGLIRIKPSKNKVVLGLIVAVALFTIIGNAIFHYTDSSSVWGELISWTWSGLIALSISEFYYSRFKSFLTIWQLVLMALLLLSAIMNVTEINMSISSLFTGVLHNSRISRVGIGFSNVNFLGSFAGTLMMISVFQIIKNNLRIFSITTFLFGLLLLLNAGSRTPLIAFVVATIVGGIIIVLKRWGKMLWLGVTAGLVIATLWFVLIIYFDTPSSAFFKAYDLASSKRLSLGYEVAQYLKKHHLEVLGTGLRNKALIKELFFPGWTWSIQLDSSIGYYLFTLGNIGLTFIIGIWVWILIRIEKYGSKIAVLTGLYVSVFMFFEHVLFTYAGFFGAFWTTLIFILLRMVANRDEHAISIEEPVIIEESLNLSRNQRQKPTFKLVDYLKKKIKNYLSAGNYVGRK